MWASGDDYSGLSFLVVDDFQGMRSMLRDILHQKNAGTIDLCMNGGEAISRLSKHHYDVVLCDYNLGPGRNGQQVLEEAKVRGLIGPACAWIMITGEKTNDAVFGAVEYQPDAYLIKPVTAALIFARLEKIWAKKSAFQEIDYALRARNFSKALRLCSERIAVDKVNAVELMRLKIGILINLGEMDQAAELYQLILNRRDFPWAKAGLARILMEKGNLAEAEQLLHSVLIDHPAYLEAYDLQARVLQLQGMAAEAKLLLDRAIQLSPNSTARQRLLGELALESGDLESAEKAFRKSVAIGEFSVFKSPDSFIGLAKTCSAKGSPEEALQVLTTLQKTFTGPTVQIQAKIVEGQVYQRNQQPVQAKAVAVALGHMLNTHFSPLDENTSLELATLLFAEGTQEQREQAQALLQGLVKNNHDDQKLLEKVQSVFTGAGMEEAGNALVESTRKEASDMMAKGVMLAREGKLDEAVEWLRNAKTAMPTNLRVLLNTAHVMLEHLEKNGYQADLVTEARSVLQDASRIRPKDERLLKLSTRMAHLLEASRVKAPLG